MKPRKPLRKVKSKPTVMRDNWREIKVYYCGKEIKGIKSITVDGNQLT